MKKLISRLFLLGCLTTALSTQLSAVTLSLSDSLGFVRPPEPASPTDEVGYINTLIDYAPNSTTTVGGFTYTRTGVSTAGLPDAELAGAVKVNDPANGTVDVTGFEYLLGKYDGPNGGSVIWYVGSLSGEQSIATSQAFVEGGTAYGLSHWSLYNGSGTDIPGVPDNGSTVALLGAALIVVAGIARRVGFIGMI